MKQWEGFPRGTPVIQRLETEPDGQAIIKSSWLPPGEGFTVGERRIEGGMVYVGSGLRAARGFSIEPCLIAPDMPVQWEDMDHRGDLMEYWPSYRLINPRSRGAYLHWLATGRRQPDAYVGYAFMFFYGLERRALFDLGPDSLHPDMNAITTEVKQLLEVYGKNGSFRRYSTNFLDFIAASRMSDPKSALADSPTGGRRAMSTILVGAGRHLAENQGVPADWALGYFHLHPEGWRRTAAIRCRAEFDDLFRLRYQERFKGGLRPRPHRNLRITYKPASPSFGDMPWVSKIQVPDITSDWNAIRSMRQMAEECAEDLGVYSRYVGRHPDGRSTAAARALLPDDLLDNHPSLLNKWHDWLASALSEKRMVELPFKRVLRVWSPHLAEKIVKRDAILLSLMLARVGVGIEPDVRFGAPLPKPDGKAMLFRLIEGDEGGVRSPVLASLLALAHLTAVMAVAGECSASESWESLFGVIEGAPLRIDEMARIEARLRLIVSKNPGMMGMKGQVEDIPVRERPQVGRFLVEVAAIGGEVSTDAVDALTRIFGYLGLEDVEVFRLLYALGAGEPEAEVDAVELEELEVKVDAVEPEEPEAEVDAGEPEAEIGVLDAQAPLEDVETLTAPDGPAEDIPDTPEDVEIRPPTIFVKEDSSAPPAVTDLSQPGATLDLDKIAEVLESTARAAILLTEIFEDEEDWEQEVIEVPEKALDEAFDPIIEGLDRVHAQLVERIIVRQSWGRGALQDIANTLGIPLLNGALDLINEITLDICDEPLVEGEDPVAVNAYALEELFE